MATGQGTVTIDFGVFPGSQEASVAFVDAAIGAASKVEPYVMGSDTSSYHTAADHRYLPLLVHFTGAASAGVGGTIYARALQSMIGTFTVRYIWSD